MVTLLVRSDGNISEEGNILIRRVISEEDTGDLQTLKLENGSSAIIRNGTLHRIVGSVTSENGPKPDSEADISWNPDILSKIINAIKEADSAESADLAPDRVRFGPISRDEQLTWVPIGSGRVFLQRDLLCDSHQWRNYKCATTKLLMAAYSRKVLATHSIPRKFSSGSKDKAQKQYLNEHVVSDIILEVRKLFDESEINIISILREKCDIEAKIWQMKCLIKTESQKENIPPHLTLEKLGMKIEFLNLLSMSSSLETGVLQ